MAHKTCTIHTIRFIAAFGSMVLPPHSTSPNKTHKTGTNGANAANGNHIYTRAEQHAPLDALEMDLFRVQRTTTPSGTSQASGRPLGARLKVDAYTLKRLEGRGLRKNDDILAVASQSLQSLFCMYVRHGSYKTVSKLECQRAIGNSFGWLLM